jgi:heptaprenylglyceryl phosphate synthase
MIASEMGMSVGIIGGSTNRNNEAEKVVPRFRRALDKVEGDIALYYFVADKDQIVETEPENQLDGTLSLFLPQLDEVFRRNPPQVAKKWSDRYLGVIGKSEELRIPIVPATYIILDTGGEGLSEVQKQTGIRGIDISGGVNLAKVENVIDPWLKDGDLVILESGSGARFVNPGLIAKMVLDITGVKPVVTGGVSTREQMEEILKIIECSIVFGSVAENTSPREFPELYRGFRNAYSLLRAD